MNKIKNELNDLIHTLRVTASDNAVSNPIELAVARIETQEETIRTLRAALQDVEDAMYVNDYGDWSLPSNFEYDIIFKALERAKESSDE